MASSGSMHSHDVLWLGTNNCIGFLTLNVVILLSDIWYCYTMLVMLTIGKLLLE